MEEERNRVRQQAKDMGIPWHKIVELSLRDLKLQIAMIASKQRPPKREKVSVVMPEEKEPVSPLPEPEPVVELPHGDELLDRYKTVIQTLDDLSKVEARNQELIKEFQNVWNDADLKAFKMEDLYTQTQKVTLAREALDIQEKWGDSLKDREHAYTMMLENYSNGCGRVHEHIQKQMSDLQGIIVRFEEDKRMFNSIVMSTMSPYQDNLEPLVDEFNNNSV
jgi:hypothetical protein